MALRLLAAGHSVAVWNRTREKILPALKAGATEVDNPAAVAGVADIVLMCLTDAVAVENVVFGDNGISAAATDGKLLVDFSSMRPDTTREFAQRLRQVSGMGWVDAPVSGGVKGAEEGSLAILAGGDTDDVERITEIVRPLCQRITHMGPCGAGQVTKLCNQVIVGCNLATIAEAINLAEKSGVDASKLPEALKGGFGDSLPLQIFGPRFAAGSTEPFLGHVFTMAKDVDTAADLGRENGAGLPMTAAAGEIFHRLIDLGYAEHDIGTIMKLFENKGATP